jgi:hypothetical protein
MNITTKAFPPAKSPRDTWAPSIFGNRKSGAGVPKGNIVLAVLTITFEVPNQEWLA